MMLPRLIKPQRSRLGVYSTVPSSCCQPPPTDVRNIQSYRLRSTGISYLDTWIGNQKRRPLAPAAARSQVPLNVLNSINDAPSLNSNDEHVPTEFAARGSQQYNMPMLSSYQLHNFRPNRNTDLSILIDAFKKSIQCDIPIVLDMSAFHPDGSPHYTPPAHGTLERIVNAINGHFCIVGVSNLPPSDRKGAPHSLTMEAKALNLPVLKAATNIETKPIEDISQQITSRKKRGGVAPLLKPRRALAVRNKAKTLTANTNDEEHTIEDANKLPRYSKTYPSTKVHKGSIRSGQLLTSDHPNQSLVIIGSVNPGGEIWSEGDVFVFGKLRGRVLAGLQNVQNVGGTGEKSIEQNADIQHPSEARLRDKTNTDSKHHVNSRIFGTYFDPELICIGDTFTTVDDVNKLGLDGVGPAMATLDEETGELLFERFHF